MSWTSVKLGQEEGKCSYERDLGASERAFIPGSRDGLGDMFLHMSFSAPASRISRDRVSICWAIIRARHPVLMSHIRTHHAGETTFQFTPPPTIDVALASSRDSVIFSSNIKDGLLSKYMNAPRMLSDEILSKLIISSPGPSAPNEWDLLFCAPHFTGDGSSLHSSTQELLCLLGSPKSDEELKGELQELIDGNWLERLPPAFETRLPTRPTTSLAKGRWRAATAKINYELTARREIGNHVLPRAAPTLGKHKNTVMIEHAFTEQQTKDILRKCKANGVTVNHIVFVICALVWARVRGRLEGEGTVREWGCDPVMIYTALNLRPHLVVPLSPSMTYWYLALTYFNVVLPSFPPRLARGMETDAGANSSDDGVLWYRAQTVKKQIKRITESQFLVERTQEGGRIREARAAGLPVSSSSALLSSQHEDEAPSKALFGLSLIGNLDSTYSSPATNYPEFTLHSVSTASTLKPGGFLLLAHSFRGKLWFNLCFDENAFEAGVIAGQQGALWETIVSETQRLAGV